MCDETADDCLTVAKFVLDWFIASKIMLYFPMVVYSFLMKILVTSHFFVIDIPSVDLHKINLDCDNNFYEDDPETVSNARLLIWRNEFEKTQSIVKR